MPPSEPRLAVLVIAGSDSSGASGLQSDLRTLALLGTPAAGAVTAVTSQGADGVAGIQLVDPELVKSQIEEAFRYHRIGAVKIGMLGSEGQVRAVVEALRGCDAPIILDPVLVSTSGTRLLDEPGQNLMTEELIPLVDVVTPNLDELAALTGLEVDTEDETIAAARKLIALGAASVYVKGGHRKGDPIDLFVTPRDFQRLGGKRIVTDHSRGTGCMLSTALAAFRVGPGSKLRTKDSWREALWAKNHVERALANPYVPLAGRGFPEMPSGARLQQRLAKVDGVYMVSSRDLNPRVSTNSGMTLALKGGATVVQIRAKGESLSQTIALAKRAVRTAHWRNSICIVNDRVDVALAADADGVHLGPDDMAPEDARRALPPDRIVGVSVGTLEEAQEAAHFASYLAVGAIFGSTTKSDAGDPVGLERLREIRAAFPDKKIVAIGGIDLSNIASVAEAGADAAAVVSAIVCAEDPVQATRDLSGEFERGRRLRFGGKK